MFIKFAQVLRELHRAPCAEQLQVRTCLDVGDALDGSAEQYGYFPIPEAEAHKDAGSKFLFAELLTIVQCCGEERESLACQCVELFPVGVARRSRMPAESCLGMEEGHNPVVVPFIFIVYFHSLFFHFRYFFPF